MRILAKAMASTKYIMMAMVDNMIAMTRDLFLGLFIFPCSTFMYKEVSTGLITRATKREEAKTKAKRKISIG